ncbi:MAG: WecB/TagA/CpsF family glycosyltransferase [Rhodospirillales bacterium]|nr:WecB/TagA/CpsF family glycosyltransferase [Rhodospirillales bacterium]
MSAIQLLKKTAKDSRIWNMTEFLERSDPRILAFLNAHAVTTAARNPEFSNFLLESDMLLRDGIGVKIGLKLFGMGRTENLNGTDLITLILKEIPDKSVVLFGASEDTMHVTRDKLEAQGFKNIVLTMNGFHKDSDYLEKIKETQPDIILLCMGMPRQELLAARLKAEKFPGLIICGGGWADFYSGVKPRAPLWMRKLALEWFFRLINEPKRLGKRYTVDILYFFYVVLKDRFLNKASPS